MSRLSKLTVFIISLCTLSFFIAIVLVSKLSYPLDPQQTGKWNNTWTLIVRLQQTQKQLDFFNERAQQLQNRISEIENVYDNYLRANQTVNGGATIARNEPKEPTFSDISLERVIQYRQLHRDIVELGYMVNGVLGKVPSKTSAVVSEFLSRFNEQHKSLLGLSRRLSTSSDLWNAKKLRELSKIVQSQLYNLQNPADCRQSRKLACSLNKPCGFACQVHHITYCLQIAYYTNRTMILNDNLWSYSSNGWTSVFQPISDSCRSIYDEQPLNFDRFSENATVVSLSYIEGVSNILNSYLPQNFPEEISDLLIRLHSYPPAWWTGELVYYLMRYNSEMSDDLEQLTAVYNFSYPVVGIHVRRTDKVGTEASFHPLQEYMDEVEKWYDVELYKNSSLLGPGQRRKVYIATDDPSLFTEARNTYPNYTFIGSSDVARTADLNFRYSDTSLHGIVTDIHFLSLSNYLVCTFSSQVCRLAYERMQHFHGDAGYSFRSLDDIYYFGGQREHTWVAVMDHVPRTSGEIELRRGDQISIAGNHWDGYSKALIVTDHVQQLHRKDVIHVVHEDRLKHCRSDLRLPLRRHTTRLPRMSAPPAMQQEPWIHTYCDPDASAPRPPELVFLDPVADD
uniref:GT23 domain-containing protein n=1 Tax=Trichuris muris TaxID=70415 RepID=A0A5S6QY29_TRIMR